jgi:hypothetical protein
MNKLVLLSASLAAMLVTLLQATPAQAVVEYKTFVSSAGDNMNPCTRAAPCYSLERAAQATVEGGEINCLDSGRVGGGTISKSLTIDCLSTPATVIPTFNDQVAIIVDGPGITVRLRNLVFNGVAVGSIGILYKNGAVLFVENCMIYGFGGQFPIGIGIKVIASAGSPRLFVSDSVISHNGVPTSGGGIIIQPAGSTSTRVVIERTRVESNTHGILADGTGSTGFIVVQVRDSVTAVNSGNGIAAVTQAGAASAGIVVDHSSSASNLGSGILAQGSGALVHIGNSTVVGNGAGLGAPSGGQIFSYQNNQTKGNGFDGAPTGVLTLN